MNGKLFAIRKRLLKTLAKYVYPNSLRVRLLRACRYRIGEGAYIGEDLIIIDELKKSDITLEIGDRASIAPRVTMVMHSAPNESRLRPHINEQYGGIIIGPDAWIGTGAVIFPNVTVGEGAVVGSNSVVTRDVPPYTIVAGLPARVIRKIEVPWRESESG